MWMIANYEGLQNNACLLTNGFAGSYLNARFGLRVQLIDATLYNILEYLECADETAAQQRRSCSRVIFEYMNSPFVRFTDTADAQHWFWYLNSSIFV